MSAHRGAKGGEDQQPGKALPLQPIQPVLCDEADSQGGGRLWETISRRDKGIAMLIEAEVYLVRSSPIKAVQREVENCVIRQS